MKWEYKTVKLQPNSFFDEGKPSFESFEADKLINQLGQNGWELVSTEGIIDAAFGHYPTTEAVILFFKRPLAE